MSRIRLYLLGFLLFILSIPIAQAQSFGGFSNNIIWKEIETPHFKIIFPAGLESKADRVASDIEYMISKKQPELDFTLKKINIVLNNEGVESNGYVAPMPYHSMFYLTPPQDANAIGTQDWLDGLVTHEYRHVWQFNQMRSGLCDFFQVLMGDKGWGGYIDMVFPDWYFEGDAVMSETSFSKSGRGRLPYFSLTERAMALDSVKYKYIKVRNGSFKDELPNHYAYGYNLLAYGQKKYGEENWRKVVKRASNLSGVFFPFSHALKRETGLCVNSFYDSMRVDFSKYTFQKAAARKVTDSKTFSKASEVVSNYYQSCYETDSSLLVLKNSYQDLLAFYRINIKTGEEEKLYEVGSIDNPWFSYAKGMVVWSEFRTDPRRWNEEYSIVKKLSLKTLESIDLTNKTKYFSPAYSPDRKKIAVIEKIGTKNSIKCIDPVTGNDLGWRFLLGDTLSASSLTFSDDGSSLVFILKKAGQLALFEYKFLSNQLNQLTDYSANAITNPVVKGNKVYFSASFQGQDDIFYVERNSKSLYRVTNSRVGAYYPALSPDGKRVIFSNYTLKGFNLQQVNLPDSCESIQKIIEPAKMHFYSSEIYTKPQDITDSVKTSSFGVKTYNRMAHAINIHSWGPMSDSNTKGIEIYSDNILNNTSLLGGVYYNTNNKLSYANVSAYYGGYYPVLYGGYTQTFDASYQLKLFECGGILPFDFSNAVFAKSFSVQVGYLNQQIVLDKTNSYPVSGTHLVLKYDNYKYSAKQQVDTRLGVSLLLDTKTGRLNYQNEIYSIPEITLINEIYLPGLAKTHAIKIELDEKKQTLDGYFMDEMKYARGYDRPDSAYSSYGRIGFNYQLPLCYPEFGINGIFYLKRLRLNLFADYAHATLYDSTGQSFSSVGAELYFDINWFNFAYIPFYIRYSKAENSNQKNIWEIGVPVISF